MSTAKGLEELFICAADERVSYGSRWDQGRCSREEQKRQLTGQLSQVQPEPQPQEPDSAQPQPPMMSNLMLVW